MSYIILLKKFINEKTASSKKKMQQKYADNMSAMPSMYGNHNFRGFSRIFADQVDHFCPI